jgi:hypothetical protein
MYERRAISKWTRSSGLVSDLRPFLAREPHVGQELFLRGFQRPGDLPRDPAQLGNDVGQRVARGRPVRRSEDLLERTAW